MFSKLLHKENAEDEYARTRPIKELDLDERFFLLPLWEPCEIKGRFTKQFEEMKQCDEFWKQRGKPPANHVLQYRNGGPILANIVLRDGSEYTPFFAGLRNLLRGVALLHDNGFAHLDIKADNVVVQKETNIVFGETAAATQTVSPRFNVRLIDFGLSIDLSTAHFPTGNLHQDGATLLYRPFDLRYIASPPDPSTVAEQVQKFNTLLITKKNEYMFEIPAEFFANREKPRLTEEFVKTVLFAKPYPDICPTLAKAADVYSLGILLGVQYGYRTGHTVSGGHPMCLVGTAENRVRKIPLTPQLKTALHMSDAMYAWHETVFQEITIPFYTLIGRMLELDPEARPSIETVLAEYEALLSRMETHFTKDAVNAHLIPFLQVRIPPDTAAAAAPAAPAPPKGGAVIGRGAYGCGIVPSLRCKASNVRNSRKLSKLVTQETAEEEFRQVKALSAIDPTQQFFLYPTYMCRTKGFSNERPNREACGIPNATYLLQSSYGGVSLDQLKLDGYQERGLLFQGLLRLLEGVQRLHQFGIAHMDIAPRNIVVNRVGEEEAPAAFEIRLIDFGLSLNRNEISEFPISDTRYSRNMLYWPFDLRWVVKPYAERMLASSSQQEFLSEQRQNYSIMRTYNLAKIEHLPLSSHVFPETVSQFTQVPYQTLGPRILMGTDVFGLGIVLGTLYETYFSQVLSDGVVKIPIYSRTRTGNTRIRYIPVQERAHTIHDGTVYEETLARDLSLPFYTLVARMLHPDPMQRATMDEVVVAYQTLLPAFQRFSV